MVIIEAIILAVSLCADCFAVSLCSSVTIKKISWAHVIKVAIAFAVIQTLLLLAGWAFGYLFVGLVERIAHIIGFLLLLYVGGGMLLEGLKGKSEAHDLNGTRNIIIGGIATSIDALAVGVSQSLAGSVFLDVLPVLISVFVVTAATVIGGIFGGKTVGKKFGQWAEMAGGFVLILIGFKVLFG